MKRTAALTSLLLAATGVTLAVSSADAVTWPPATSISAAGEPANSGQFAVGADGTTTAVWVRSDGSDNLVQASIRPPGGAWGTPATLSAAGSDAAEPQVATAPDGTTTAVWSRNDGVTERIQASTRPPGGAWGAPADLSAALQNGNSVQIAAGPDGTFTVLWHHLAGGPALIKVSTRATNGTWTAPFTLSDPAQEANVAQVAIGGEGTATAVWASYDGIIQRIQASSRPPGGSWSPAVTLSGETFADSPQVAAGPGGTATAVWYRSVDSDLRVEASSRPPGGSWSTAALVSEASESADVPQVDVAPDGTATAVWSRSDGVDDRVQVSTRAPGGAWATPLTVSAAGGFANDPQVQLAPDGTTVLVWRRWDGSDVRTQVSTRAPGAAWTTPVTLSETGQNSFTPQVAVGPDGTAVIGFNRSDGVDARVWATVVDDAFPPPPVVPDTSKIKGKKVIKKAKAKYTFSSPTPGATFECRVDKKFKRYAGVSKKKAKKQVPWKACSSPYILKAKKLKPGKHKLYVRAVLKGQVDPTPSVKKLKVVR